jgi:cytochrome b561
MHDTAPPGSPLRYGTGAIVLHWVMAILVVIVAILGLLHDSWPRSTQAYWINVHALIGLLVWVLLLTRFVWRQRHPPPALPPELGPLARRFAAPVHWLLYALLFVIPIIGIVTFIWHGRKLNLGFLQVDFGVKSNRAIFHPTEDIHGYLAYVLFGLVGLHALAALAHQFVGRHEFLQRMWPRRSS